MTITWLNKSRTQQKDAVGGLLDKLWEAQDKTIPATYVGTTTPTDTDFNSSWSNKVGYTAQPGVGSSVQWYNPDKGVIEDHYTKVPEDNTLSSGEYHQNGYVDPLPWTKHVHTFHGDGFVTEYSIGEDNNDFPTNYRDIVILVSGKTITEGAGASTHLLVRKNGYSTANHNEYYWLQQGTGTTTQTNTSTNTGMRMHMLSRSTKLFGSGMLVIPNYSGARTGRTVALNWKGQGVVPFDDGTAADDLRVGYWGGRSTLVGVVDSSGITIIDSSAAGFAKGTVISVYVRNPIPS